jgi:hypothetical protein
MTVAGAKVLAGDFPPAVTLIDTTAIANISSTSAIPGSPEVGVIFIAATSGAALVNVALGGRDNGSTNRVFLSTEVYVGSDATGVKIVTASVAANGCSSAPINNAGYQYVGRAWLLTGLTAGATYYARTVYYVDAGNTADIVMRGIVVTPTS